MNDIRHPPIWLESAPLEAIAMSAPWHLTLYGLEELQRLGDYGSRETIAIIDTGGTAGHAEFGDRIVNPMTFMRTSPGDGFDDNGHGTATASMALGATNGPARRAKYMPLKALGANGGGRNSDIADAIRFAVEYGATLINMSLGASRDDPKTRKAIEYAKDNYVPCHAASGNESENHTSYPAANCVSHGSVKQDLTISRFSNTGKRVDLVAPGEAVRVALPDGRFQLQSGTSFSSPLNCGIHALLLTAERIIFGEARTVTDDAMRAHSGYVVDLGPSGRDVAYGLGLIDCQRLVAEYLQPEPTPALPGSALARVEMPNGDRFHGMLQKERSGVE